MRKIKIKSIEKLNKPNDRYDLTIPKNHNFFANGILIHNTSGRTGHVKIKYPGFITGLIMKAGKIPLAHRLKGEVRRNNLLNGIKKSEKYKIFKKYSYIASEAIVEKIPEKFVKKIDRTTNYITDIGSRFHWGYISGTRKTVLDPQEVIDNGYYSSISYRTDINNFFKKTGLKIL